MDDLNIQAGVTVNAEQAERAFTNLGDKAQKMANEVTKAADKAGKATDGMGDGAEKGAEKFTRAESRMRTAIQKSTRELEMLGKTASQKFEAQLEFKGLDKAKFQPFLDELRKAEEATKKAESGLSGLGSAAQAAGRAMAVAFSGAAAFGVVGKLVEVQREFDVLNSSLKTVTGSSAAAERELSWLKTFAKETPFGLAQATQGFVKMKALGLDPTRAALTSFGNTASAMGKDLNQMIEAVADASTGEFERLKEFGIKAKKEGDNVSLTFQGVTTTIKNSAEEITKYLENIGNTSFGGAMEERAKTLDGTIAALGDTWDELFRTVSTNNVGGLIFDSVTLANGALEDATTILRALGGAAQDAGRDTGALSTIQSGIATVFETVAVLGANLKFVLVGIGNEIGGLAAQVAAAARFDFAGVRAIREQMVADAEEARRQVDLTTERILGARKAQEEYARYATRNASAATDPRRIDLGKPGGNSVAAPSKPTKAELSDYDKLIQKLGQEIPKAAAEAEAAQMGYNKAQTEFLALAASPAWAKFTNAQRATVAALFENKIASEQSADAAKTLAKANFDAAASREKYLTSLSTGLDKIKADTAAQLEATARLGLSKEAIAELDAAKLEMLATDLELQAIKALDRNLDEQTYNALKQQAEAYRELAAAKKAGATKEMALDLEKANKEAAKKAEDEWQRTADSINNSLTDALLRGFESGKDFAKNMRDTIVNMFKTMVLRPIVEMGVRGSLSMLGLGGASGAANAAGAASDLSTAAGLGNGASMLSGMSGWLTDFGGSVANGIIKAGEMAYQAGFESIGRSMMSLQEAGNFSAVSNGLNAVGNGLGYLNAAMAASEGKWGQAVGAGIGTYFGGPIGSAIGGALGGWVDDAFGGGHEYTTGTGISGKFSGSNFAGRNYQDWRNDGSSGFFGIGASGSSSGTNYSAMGAAQQKSLGLAYGNLLAQTAGFATALGANAASITGYQKDIKLALGSDAEANKKAIAAMFKGIADDVAAVVLDSRFMREGEGAADTLARLATNLTTVNGALDTLGDNLLTVSQSSGDAASSLVDAFGGLQAYQSAISSYYQRFYTQEERLAKTREQLVTQMGALGLSVPDSTAAFRDLVNAQDLSTEAGRKTYTALIGMSSAFADITDAAQSAQLKLSDVAKSLQTLLQSVTSARESVAGARNEVNPAPVMDASSIRAAVLVATTSASTAAMNAAAQDLGAKTVAASQSSAALTTAQTMAEAKAELLAAAVTDNAALVAKYKTAATTAQNLATGYGMSINSSKATSTFANDAYSYDPKTNQVNDFNNFGYRTWSNSLITKIGDIVVGSATTSYNTLVNKQSLQNALRGNSPGYTYQPGSGTYEAGSLIDILSGANTKLAEQSKKIAEAQAASAAAQAALTTATTNKAAADAAAKAAATEYTKAVDAWTAEASKSVPQLTKLRDETLRYYEAQKALAEGMATSAANLRAAVAATRATQLDPLASAQQQQRDFAKNYALALSTTGAVQAGYADKLAAALPTLSDALKATQSTGDWMATMARLFAQSNAIADQLDANAPKDFQAESLGLLDSIDSALTVLDDSTRAITRAIEASGGVTAAGLRAVVSTLGGVPSFDVGTNYVPRDMFARIHEGEAIVPKAYNPFRSGSMGAGLGDTSRLEALVEQQAQQLAALRAELRAITIHTANTAENTRSMDKNGVLVFNDPQAPIETKVVPA